MWWQCNGNHAKPVKQVLAEPAGSDFPVKVFIGAGNDTNVHLDSLFAAAALEGAILQYTEELCLNIGG